MSRCNKCGYTWRTLPGEEADHECPRCGPVANGKAAAAVEVDNWEEVGRQFEALQERLDQSSRNWQEQYEALNERFEALAQNVNQTLDAMRYRIHLELDDLGRRLKELERERYY